MEEPNILEEYYLSETILTDKASQINKLEGQYEEARRRFIKYMNKHRKAEERYMRETEVADLVDLPLKPLAETWLRVRYYENKQIELEKQIKEKYDQFDATAQHHEKLKDQIAKDVLGSSPLEFRTKEIL